MKTAAPHSILTLVIRSLEVRDLRPLAGRVEERKPFVLTLSTRRERA